jgi:nucleotide-binding universal stress UspA family protein
MPAIRTILHPTALSKVDRAALRVAGSLAQAHGARLIVLHVMKPWYLYGRARMLGNFLRQKMERWEALNQVRAADLDLPLQHRLMEGEPVSAILRVAEELPCDLIVMGTIGRSGLRRLLKGSTAEAIVRKAPCPVLAVGASLAERLPSRAPCHEALLGTEVRTARIPAGRVGPMGSETESRHRKRTATSPSRSGRGSTAGRANAESLCSV